MSDRTAGEYVVRTALNGTPTVLNPTGYNEPLTLTAVEQHVSTLQTRFDTAPPSALTWGAILGTLSSQADLSTALGLKVNASAALTAVAGVNTGDESLTTIKAKLGIATLSGSNTGDDTLTTLLFKLGITTLSGSNTGDQDLSGLATKITTVNGHALSANVVVTAGDVGAEAANVNIQAHVTSLGNPHAVTKAQVGLGSVNDTADTAKPVSTAQQTALDLKAAAAQTFYLGTSLVAINRAPAAIALTGITSIDGAAATATSATNAANVGITDDTTTNATYFVSFFAAATGNLPNKVSSTKLTFNPSTGQLMSMGLLVNGGVASTSPTTGDVVVTGGIGAGSICAREIPLSTTVASSATPTPNIDTTKTYNITALAVGATFGAPTGTPLNNQTLIIRIKDNGGAQTLTWNAAYVAGGTALPSTTTAGKIMHVGLMYNTDNALNKWMVLVVNVEV